ncbi:MAG: methionyl-tRNA synthetase [Patescibacteria group bacterium]|nr:methionyl-tRNA synthetase [Patescibacteria group bacterium]
MITYEDFKKLDLRVAKILAAEKIENSEKLLKLLVDLGGEKRQIIAGIGKYYQPDELLNKQIIIVANLEPKQLMGEESQGMLLAAATEGKLSLIVPEKEIEPGTLVK